MTESESSATEIERPEIAGRHGVLVRLVYGVVQALSVVTLAAYVIILFIQVVLRYAFNSSIFWSEEIVRYGLVWNVMLGAALITLKSGHIRIDILEGLLPPGLRHHLTTAIHLVSLLFVGLLFYYGVLFLRRTATQLSPATGLPMGVAYGAISVGAGLMMFFLLVVVLGHLRGVRDDHE